MARVGLTRERLAQAGAELADEIGFELVTVAALARRFEVKPASLYSHVTSSADLKKLISLLALQELADRASDAVAGRAGKDALLGWAHAYRDYAHEHPGRFAAALYPLDAQAADDSAGPRQSQLMRAILRSYPLAEADEVDAIRLLGSAIRGYVTIELSGGFSHSSPDSEQSWVHIIDALDSLLRNWPTR